jgi:hypothetical protein
MSMPTSVACASWLETAPSAPRATRGDSAFPFGTARALALAAALGVPVDAAAFVAPGAGCVEVDLPGACSTAAGEHAT